MSERRIIAACIVEKCAPSSGGEFQSCFDQFRDALIFSAGFIESSTIAQVIADWEPERSENFQWNA